MYILNIYYLADQNKDAVGRVSGTYGGRTMEGYVLDLWRGELEGSRQLQRLDIDGKIVLKLIFKQ